jgi:HCOMODA/2-hydroxy-3-carboxy-muconic semialdehyde decarboxylase
MNVEEAVATLVDANHILAREGVVDAYGHVSVRHPARPDRFFLSCSRSPAIVAPADIMEFSLDGTAIEAAGRTPYLERFIHAAVYEARPEVNSVVHNHSYALIPFSVTKAPIRPIFHIGARIGSDIPVWDIRDRFGDTDLLVTSMAMGHDLTATLGSNVALLMRGHGSVVTGISIQDAVLSSLYLQVNAQLQMAAIQLGEVSYLTPGEIDVGMRETRGRVASERAWQYLLSRVERR